MDARKAPSQKLITAVVEAVIAEHGFSKAIPDLLQTVRYTCQLSLEDHTNRQKKLQFKRWSKAVEDACKREKARKAGTVEQQIEGSGSRLST